MGRRWRTEADATRPSAVGRVVLSGPPSAASAERRLRPVLSGSPSAASAERRLRPVRRRGFARTMADHSPEEDGSAFGSMATSSFRPASVGVPRTSGTPSARPAYRRPLVPRRRGGWSKRPCAPASLAPSAGSRPPSSLPGVGVAPVVAFCPEEDTLSVAEWGGAAAGQIASRLLGSSVGGNRCFWTRRRHSSSVLASARSYRRIAPRLSLSPSRPLALSLARSTPQNIPKERTFVRQPARSWRCPPRTVRIWTSSRAA